MQPALLLLFAERGLQKRLEYIVACIPFKALCIPPPPPHRATGLYVGGLELVVDEFCIFAAFYLSFFLAS
jgi:hypothetical protein